MLKLLNQLQQRLIDALNKVEAPDFVGLSDDDSMRPRQWVASTEFDSRPILAFKGGKHARFALQADGTVHMRACEEAVLTLEDGDVMVQRRDVDDALQAVSPAFRKTGAFRRLDGALENK